MPEFKVHNLWPIPVYQNNILVKEKWKVLVKSLDYERTHNDNSDISSDRYVLNSIPDLKLEIEDLNEFAKVSISDSGLGIPEDVAQKIFEPFYTTKAVGKGTGLGLSLANKIIKSHGGIFQLDHESKNTKFDMIFPKQAIQKSAA